MKVNLLHFVFILFGSDVVRANVSNASDALENRKLTNVDVLLERIKDRKWDKEDLPCLNTMVEALSETKNFTLWAVWMVDSMQLPVGQLYGSHYHIGNYDECMNPLWLKTHPEFKTQYCVADLHLTLSSKNKNMKVFDPKGSAETYFKTRTKHDRDFGRMTWGSCVPATCKPAAIIKIYRTFLEVSHLNHFSDEANITITSCEEAGRPNDLPKTVHWFRWSMGMLFVMACLCSYYTKLYYKSDQKSYFQEAIRAFCFRRNINSLTKIRDDEIYIFNFMRLGSSGIVALGHLAFALYGRMIVNGLRVEEDVTNFLGYTHHLDLVVDTFFLLSGFLIARGFFNGNWTNPFKFLTKRYLRVAVCMGFVTYIKAYVSYYMGDGPFWPKLAGPERDACVQNGWQNLAMINVYSAGNQSCYLISWSPTVDFHMSIIAVMLCCMYRKSKGLAVTTFWILFILTTGAAGLMSYIKQLPPVVFHGVESVVDYRKNALLESTYITTHTRGGSYLVGVAFGFIVARYKPGNYRKVISKKWTFSLIITALTIMAGITVVGHNLYMEPNRLGIALFAGCNRGLWSIMVAVIIAACEYGDLGDVRAFINWFPIVPLSRLTFGVFLLHMLIVERNVLSARTLYRFDSLIMTVEGLGILCLAFLGSFLLWLLLEAPTINLADLLLNGIKGGGNVRIKTETSITKL